MIEQYQNQEQYLHENGCRDEILDNNAVTKMDIVKKEKTNRTPNKRQNWQNVRISNYHLVTHIGA